jgi:hypothetical protein
MEGLLLTWGKTWHTWPDPSTGLPMDEPLLMWSANRDGHVSEKRPCSRDFLVGRVWAGRLPGAGYSGEVANSPPAGS